MRTTIQSSSNADRTYEIHTARDGAIVCSCPAWRYQRTPGNRRVCKHIRQVQATFLNHIANASR